MPVKFANLQVDQGAAFVFTVVWIAGGQGVNPTGAASLVTMRQTPADAPIVSLSTTANAQGVVVYLSPVTLPYVPPGADQDFQPTVITVYPMQVQVYQAGISALVFPFVRWSWLMTFPGSQPFAFIAGDVEVLAI